MKSGTARILVPIVVGVIVAIGFIAGTGTGTLSAIGWQDVSIICPLGALTTMLASQTVLPRAAVSLAIGIVLMVFFGRLFCGWICPVPVTRKLPRLFRKRSAAEDAEADMAPRGEGRFDSRHLVLLGAVLSATVFGFPVFCLICPIGLSFATIFLVIGLFGGGDITWSLIVVPALLLLEATVLRKWCSRICPLGAAMSLLNRLNRKTLRPEADVEKCIESGGKTCGRCSAVCEAGIDPRHPLRGTDMSECLKCRACVECCPGKAVSIPLLAKAPEKPEGERAA